MKLRSEATGEWPTGLHWTPGEVRDVSVPKGADVPSWLVEVKGKGTKKPPIDGG